MTWQSRAACRGPQARAFFPPTSGERRHERADREQRAKAICAQCSVRATCLDYALSIRERHGVWGGLSESERRVMLKTAESN
ncbi:MAG: WhiB family transcriptional regulator [Actinomycetota bacterium]